MPGIVQNGPDDTVITRQPPTDAVVRRWPVWTSANGGAPLLADDGANGGHDRLGCREFMLVFVVRGRGCSVPLSGQAFDVDSERGAGAGTSV
jgi:hypothetical protein